jgi:ABC-type amino acid transport substrate-binding protein
MGRLLVTALSLAFALPAAAQPLRVIAINSDFFLYEKDGKPAGIEYDILEYFAKSRNTTVEVTFVDSFGELLDAVSAGKADVASGTITITPERARRVAFSAGYFPVQIVLVERMSDGAKALSDLAGSKVGAFARTTAEDALKAVPGIQIVTDGGTDVMLKAIQKGELRAAAFDSSAVIPVLESYPDLKIGLALGEQQSFGFALPKNSELTAPLSQTILKLKESGIYFRIVTAHMGSRASEIVRAAKIE